MTISEHLQFSVLTAPVASLDRRTLSQAWYSALYGGRQAPQQHAETPTKVQHQALAQREPIVTRRELLHEPHRPPTPRHVGVRTSASRSTEVERRGPHSSLARKIERTFLHSKHTLSKASFTLEGEHGRVQILLRSNGSQLNLIAICAPKAKAQVAHALAQARYALALRGINLDAQAREQAS